MSQGNMQAELTVNQDNKPRNESRNNQSDININLIDKDSQNKNMMIDDSSIQSDLFDQQQNDKNNQSMPMSEDEFDKMERKALN